MEKRQKKQRRQKERKTYTHKVFVGGKLIIIKSKDKDLNIKTYGKR